MTVLFNGHMLSTAKHPEAEGRALLVDVYLSRKKWEEDGKPLSGWHPC